MPEARQGHSRCRRHNSRSVLYFYCNYSVGTYHTGSTAAIFSARLAWSLKDIICHFKVNYRTNVLQKRYYLIPYKMIKPVHTRQLSSRRLTFIYFYFIMNRKNNNRFTTRYSTSFHATGNGLFWLYLWTPTFSLYDTFSDTLYKKHHDTRYLREIIL